MSVLDRIEHLRERAVDWALRAKPVALLLVRLSLAAVFVLALDEFLYIVMALVIVALGAGLFSLDTLAVRILGKSKPTLGDG
jgi:hypothetical protein